MNETTATNQQFTWLLDYAIEHRASDLHITPENPPTVRVDGQLQPLDLPAYTTEQSTQLVGSIIGRNLLEKISKDKQELDFSFSYRDLRFRCNAFFTKGSLAASIRLLPNQIGDLASLGVPPIVGTLVEHNQGLLVVTGPTGHGKSTTLAAIVNQISEHRRSHIITIEDPIEFIFQHKKSFISQREVGIDTPSFPSALRAALREDPDVVLLGEMRDLETVEAALQMAETGHLVLTTLHTNSAAQTADRIIGFFEPHHQNQIRQQLSDILLGVVAQRLIPRIQGGMILASEVMIANSAARSIIREGKTHQIQNLIQTSAAEGMVSLEKSLADLVSRGEITLDDALNWAADPKTLRTMIY